MNILSSIELHLLRNDVFSLLQIIDGLGDLHDPAGNAQQHRPVGLIPDAATAESHANEIARILSAMISRSSKL